MRLEKQVAILRNAVILKYVETGTSSAHIDFSLAHNTRLIQKAEDIKEAVFLKILLRYDANDLVVTLDLDSYPADQQSDVIKLIDLMESDMIEAINFATLKAMENANEKAVFDEAGKNLHDIERKYRYIMDHREEFLYQPYSVVLEKLEKVAA